MIQPKYSLETEQEVLETIMHFSDHNNVRVQKAMLQLNTDCFYNPDSREIFRLIRDCFSKQLPFHFVDILVLIPKTSNELYDFLTWLIDNYGKCHAGESNFEAYVTRLITLSKLRKQLILAENMIKEVRNCASPETSAEILASSLTEISGLSYRESKHGVDYIEIAEEFYDGKMVEEMKIPTTCDQLNTVLEGGLMPKSLVIAAAAPSVGKTGFSIFLMNAIASNFPDSQSLFFSIEMEYKHIWRRHVGICAGKPFDKLSYDERMGAVTKLMSQSTKVYDAETCREVADIDFILTTARLRAMEKPISVIVVDYLGLVESKQHYERNDLKQTDITTKLARLAIELNCTVIALSQINRGAANRAIDDRCPWPHDASDSSGGHKSASYWLGLDRPELYQDDPCYRNQFVVKCRKNRFGNTFDLIFAFNEGTFAEVPNGWFRNPQPMAKNAEKALFSPRGRDFSDN
jgi:replicative DNA helicase